MLMQSFQIKEQENSNFDYLSWASLVVLVAKSLAANAGDR